MCATTASRRTQLTLIVLAYCVVIALSAQASSQVSANGANGANLKSLNWGTDSPGPPRFVSVHGRRAAVFGYPQDRSRGFSDGGLEVWAYPVQILTGYSVAFRPAGTTTAIDGQTILRRIIYSPDKITRIYAGPDFVVRENIFVPIDEPGAVFTYEIEGERQIDIEVRFNPALDLMWPAAVGGQEARWDASSSGYLITELTHRFAASITSPDIVEHDSTENTSRHVERGAGLAFTLRAPSGQKSTRVVVAGGLDSTKLAKKLLASNDALEHDASEHYSHFLGHALHIETPDPELNRALEWSEIALDQAWVCNPDLGCGIVAGYGPSRNARRPQYDWFFAGDGMVAIEGLLAAGEHARAKEELEFILKYQNQHTGMIWHEMSQSAGLVDWSKFPYMFEHVDLTFDFLGVLSDYYSATGDKEFLKAHWPSIESAYKYCRSTLDAHDGLPRIPADKEGGREQDALTDELSLSAGWVASAKAFATLATATGHSADATQATALSDAARTAVRKRYWDEPNHRWITGFTRGNVPLVAGDIGPGRVMDESLFSPAQRDAVLDEMAGSDYQTDWGTRGNGSNSQTYKPNSYASGSVWATGTAEIASVLWSAHRPASAWPVWNSLVPWSAFDSIGHMHEAMAGDFFHEEVESVPEQTWSSSSFFSSAMHGLLGLQVDAAANRLTFAPHLPPSWNEVEISKLRVADSEIVLKIVRSSGNLRLVMQNSGPSVDMVFAPQIPLGARINSARLGNAAVAAVLEENVQDTHARTEFAIPHGASSLAFEYSGGVDISIDPTSPEVGEASKALKITKINLHERRYAIDFDYVPANSVSFDLRTPWKIKGITGATYKLISPDFYRISVTTSTNQESENAYRHGRVAVTFVE